MALDAELAAEHNIWAMVDLIQEGMRQHERISLIFPDSMASNAHTDGGAPDLGNGDLKKPSPPTSLRPQTATRTPAPPPSAPPPLQTFL
ncbi:unnamed protein product [Linum trigynum]|uniref:Uncharacterized protein n=1 Tax=Linum trigynum TaxID=586398 RepID=A0AAV2ES28_9ROSI